MTMHALDLHAPPAAGARRAASTPPAAVALILIAAAPAANALATWAPGGTNSAGLLWVRFSGLPLLALELACIALALRAGFSPLRSLLALGRWPAAALGALVALAYATALFAAPDRDGALLRTATTALHLLFGLALGHLFARWRDWPRFWWALVAGALAYAAMVPLYVAAITTPETFNWQHFGLGVTNIRHTGFVLLPAAALALGLAANARGRAFAGACGAAALCFGLFFWSGSRAPVAAILAAATICAVCAPSLRTARLAIALVLAVAGGLALSTLHRVDHPVFGTGRIARSGALATPDAVASGRVELWSNSLDAIVRRPVFGHGEGQFQAAVTTAFGAFQHPHNAPLQLLFQWGLAGLLLAAPLAALAWWRVLAGVRAGAGEAAPALLALTALGAYALTDGVIFFTYPLMILAALLAAGLTAARGVSARV